MKEILFCLCFGISIVGSAQKLAKVSFSASLNPTITYGLNTASSNAPISSQSPQTFKEYSDSVKSFEIYKLSLGATVWASYSMNRNWSVQAGVGYSEVGFTRRQTNLRLGDKLFPGVGSTARIEDISQTVKNIDYSFRFQYLTIPVLFNYHVKRSKDFKWSYYFTGGAALNVLIKHQMKAKLDNFYIDDKNRYNIDSTGYTGSRLALNLFLGGKIEYKVDSKITVFGQPMITVFPTSVSKNELHSRPLGLQMNIGLTYNFNGGGREE